MVRYWQDQTIRIDSEGQLEIATDGEVHVTWLEEGVTFTIIVPQAEAVRLAADLQKKLRDRAATREAEAVAAS